ncbi:MAG TPA: SRPBCC domain-containing protein [Gemmatimonadaceae bacterium]|jgi:hypothetical protein|nr:SRPBCC domain-containing protein [Gemmatimonadaceae bacterium]
MTTLRILPPATLLALLASGASAQTVANSSHATADGRRVLQQSIEIPASLGQAWDAFTTTDGLRAWAAPVVRADFRFGGHFESSYALDAVLGDSSNIVNRYIAFLPMRMVAFQTVQAPPTFPHRELLADIFTVVELEELAPTRVKVTISMLGYAPGGGYDVIYRFFEGGNAFSLRKLHDRFVTGPADWRKLLGRQ